MSGLNRLAELKAERKKKAADKLAALSPEEREAERQAARLDPPFPYSVRPFDLEFLDDE